MLQINGQKTLIPGINTVVVPEGAHHVDLQVVDGDIIFWYIADSDETKTQTLTFRSCYTGEMLEPEFYSKFYWIKTVQYRGYILHWFLGK